MSPRQNLIQSFMDFLKEFVRVPVYIVHVVKIKTLVFVGRISLQQDVSKSSSNL